MEVSEDFTNVETLFNMAGSIPIVGFFSASLRTILGKIQFVAGIALGIVGLIGQMFNNGSKKWEDLATTGLTHIVHGGLNFARGIGEGLLAVTLVGSLGLLAWQSVSQNKFAPIVKYDRPLAAYSL